MNRWIAGSSYLSFAVCSGISPNISPFHQAFRQTGQAEESKRSSHDTFLPFPLIHALGGVLLSNLPYLPIFVQKVQRKTNFVLHLLVLASASHISFQQGLL